MAVELADATRIPALCEPWFLTFQAEVQLHPAMTPEDLKRSGLEGMSQHWG